MENLVQINTMKLYCREQWDISNGEVQLMVNSYFQTDIDIFTINVGSTQTNHTAKYDTMFKVCTWSKIYLSLLFKFHRNHFIATIFTIAEHWQPWIWLALKLFELTIMILNYIANKCKLQIAPDQITLSYWIQITQTMLQICTRFNSPPSRSHYKCDTRKKNE